MALDLGGDRDRQRPLRADEEFVLARRERRRRDGPGPLEALRDPNFYPNSRISSNTRQPELGLRTEYEALEEKAKAASRTKKRIWISM